ncbi:hypothetical protein [Methanomethylovorans sp.]|uniref:hypothetical protein n=1 Tax=Methanomethylovorans sp. TaxID=2758717 RepID=UPI00345E3B51
MNGYTRHRGRTMKVRLEIIDEDGTTHVNVEFTGDEWQKCLVSFIESFTGKEIQASGPSSASAANYNTSSCQPTVSQPPPQVVSHPYQQSSQVFQLPHMVPQPVVQTVSPQFFPQHQPLAYPYTLYPQYQQMVPSANLNYFHPPQVQYNSPSPNASVVNQYMPVNNTSHQSVQEPLVRQEQQISSARKMPSFQERVGDTKLTISERLELFLKYEYPHIWFSSQDVQKHYEKIYGPIKLSTVSTYLSRMFGKGLLERRGNRTQREYMYISDEPSDLQTYQGIPHQNMV